VNRRFAFLYVGWIALCAVLFFALAGAEDPSRRHDRILSTDAGARAAVIAGRQNPRYRGYDIVHVAYESGKWIVLLDRLPHTALRDAIVVELRASDGALLAMRPPSGR
jgi:hypothetical protein